MCSVARSIAPPLFTILRIVLKVADLIKRWKILEQRRDHLIMMRRKSKLELVRREQRKVKLEETGQLQLRINKLGPTPLDPSKCEVSIPTPMVNKESKLMITVRDINNDLVTDSSEEI